MTTPDEATQVGPAHIGQGATVSHVDESPHVAVTTASVLDEDERRELERLRNEVATMRAAPAPRRHGIRWKSLAAAVLLVLGCVGVPASVLAIWTHNQVTQTDRFVATVSPVIEDPAVQSALTNRITTEVLTYVDVQQLANDAIDAIAAQGVRPELVDRLHDLTGPLVSGVTNLVHGKVQQLVASPQFIAAWNRALQVAHEQANAVLSGESSAITIKNGMVVLDLNPFIEAAKQQLVTSGFSAAAKIPEVHPTVDLAPASGLIRAQTAYQMLDAVASWLPWITLLLLAAGVYLARRRRRALLGVGLGVVAGMLVLAVALLVGRAMLVNAVPEQGVAAAAATYDILVRFLRIALRTLAVLGLVIALGAYLVGPAAGAVQIRAALDRGIRALRPARVAEALAAGPVGPWVHAHRQLLRLAALGLAVLVFILLDRPTGWDVLLVAIGLVLALAIIEFLDQAPEQAASVETTGAENLPVPTGGASRAAEHGSALPVPAKRE